MRLNPGVTIARADEVLRTAEMEWENAKGGSFGYFRSYIDVVEKTYTPLLECFAEPDLAGAIRGDAYWHLLSLDLAFRSTVTLLVSDLPPSMAPDNTDIRRANNEAHRRVIDDAIRELAQARAELNTLKELAARPGLPLVLDTNVFHTWERPDQIDWPAVLRGWNEPDREARLVVPLRVVDELDKQKYGDGFLARSATKAVRFLQQTLAGRTGEAAAIRPGRSATLEVWIQTEDRGGDADLAILRCTSDLDGIRDGGARVVTGDLGMQLRAEHMGLRARLLPDSYKKKRDDD
ncbi:PIN domain-containing protein [Actinoplanes sp. CA-030573]|uniref:PIN domain-containing protein n=1 Tax=Actinoplanes sp. CA-030573 TaxID=3239898 RepID=UPI003D94B921